MSFSGFSWVSLSLIRFFSTFIGFDRVLLGFIGFYWVLPGFTGFYWVSLGFTGFNRVLPDCTGLLRRHDPIKPNLLISLWPNSTQVSPVFFFT